MQFFRHLTHLLAIVCQARSGPQDPEAIQWVGSMTAKLSCEAQTDPVNLETTKKEKKKRLGGPMVSEARSFHDMFKRARHDFDVTCSPGDCKYHQRTPRKNCARRHAKPRCRLNRTMHVGFIDEANCGVVISETQK